MMNAATTASYAVNGLTAACNYVREGADRDWQGADLNHSYSHAHFVL